MAPTLFIVGELDTQVLQLNRRAPEHLSAVKELAIVPGATHLSKKPGILEQAANLAKNGFVRHL